MTKQSRTFEVPGEARGKMRPKASSFGGHARVYTPSKQVEYENWVRLCYEAAHPGAEPIGVALAASVEVMMPVPKSASRKKARRMLDGLEAPTKKPDLDNVAKSILDALNGLAYKDDALVCSLHAIKAYSESPKVVVTLTWDGESGGD